MNFLIQALSKDGTLYFGNSKTLFAIKGQSSDFYIKASANNSNPNPGSNITLTFKFDNNGPDISYKTIFKFIIPAGMRYV